jgi:PAS domain S-box-containing protein
MEHHAKRPGKKRILLPHLNRAESVPVALFILLFAVLYSTGPDLRSGKYVFEPPWLLFALNTVFVTGLCLLVAWLSIRSYLRGGFLNVLLLGCGVLALGLSSFMAGWLIRPPYGPDDTLTIHNTGVLFASVCFFLSSLSAVRGVGMETAQARRGPLAGAAYLGIFLLGILITVATMHGWTPPFFIPGEGPTPIRQVVLAVSVTLLAVSAILMTAVYADRKTDFLFYTVNSLLLIAAGLVAVALGMPGSPLSWLGRTSQYLGDVYLVVAAVKALNEAKSRGTTVEEALADFFRKSETHYRTLIEMAPDPILAIDQDGNLILMNPAAEETFGYSRSEVAGRNVAETIVPESALAVFEECLSRTDCRDMEMELVKKNGMIFPAELAVSPVMKSGNRMARTLIIRDVTQRKRVEEALRESELRFRTLAEATFEGIAVTEEGRFIDVNEQFCALSGYDRAELIGVDVATLVHPDDRDRILDNILSGRESKVEHALIRRDGGTILVEAHGKNILTEGRALRYTSIRDITEARRAEERLREAQLLLERRVRERTAELLAAVEYGRSLLEASLDPLVTINREGRITDVNRATEQVTGVPREQLIGADFSDYFTDPDAARRGYRKAFIEGQVRDYPLTIRHANGGTTHVMYHAGVYRNSAGEILGLFAAARDISEIRKAEEALREINESLEMRVAERTDAFQQAKDYAETLIRTANVLIIGLDAAGNVETFNDHAEKITGYSRSEILGRNWFETVVPKDRYPNVWKAFGRLQQGSLPKDHENPILTKDGRERLISWRNSEIREGDEVRGTISVGRDITERRQAEEAIRAYHELLQIAQRAAHAGIWSWEMASGRLTWSDEFYALFGLEPSVPASFAAWLSVLHPEDREPAMERIQRSIREKIPLENEYRIIRPDGRERWIRAVGNADYTEDGQPQSMSGICIDATENKQAEEALRASELRMKAVADHLPVGVWFADETGRILYGNEAGKRIWGGARYVEPDKFHVYKAWWADSGKLLEPGDWAVVRAVRNGETSINELLEIECFDGTRKTILNAAVPLKSPEGSLLGVVVLNEDVTERKLAEEALRSSRERFRLLAETAGELLKAKDPQRIVNTLCEKVMRHLNCDVFFNFLAHDELGRLRLNAWAGIPPEEAARIEWLDYGAAVCGCVARDGESIVAEHISTIPDERTELVRSYGVKAYACHPLTGTGGKVIGTLSFGTRIRETFSAEDLSLMRAVTDQVAAAMNRVRAEEAIRKAKEGLEEKVRERTVELMLLMEDLERSRNDLRRLASELVRTEERERKRISVILHDEVAQTLAATKMRLDLLRSIPGGDDYRKAIAEAEELIGQSIRQTRALMTDIANPVLYDMGLKAAVEALAEDVKARQGIPFTCSFAGKLESLGQDLEVMIFQVVKELVQNVVKHSRARSASIRIAEEEEDLRVTVADDGTGFDAAQIGPAGSEGGFGLFSIRERVKSYGGRISIESRPGSGSRVSVVLPKTAVRGPGTGGPHRTGKTI